MKRSKQHLDEWAERLAVADDLPSAEDTVAAFVGVLRSETADGATSEVRVAELAAEARRVAENPPVHRLGSQGSRLLTIRWRRRTMISSFLSTLFGKIAVGAAAVAIAATVTATGNLPAPAQQRVSDALSKAGIHVPAPDQVSAAADAAAASDESTPPVLPAQASDTAKAVHAVIFGNEALTGRAFGKAVSAAAKGAAGNSAGDHGATPAVPAVRAVQAVPAEPGVSEAKPAVPAVPATPAVPPDRN